MDHYIVKKFNIGWIGFIYSEKKIQLIKLPLKNKTEMIQFLKPRAVKGKDSPKFLAQLFRDLEVYFMGKKMNFTKIPLDLSFATDFQNKVYKNCRDIKWGDRMTYKDLAEKSKSPKAARAVGMAMRNNPYPIVIPCHRVIGSTGKLIGFNAFRGIELKKELLDMESKI